MNLFSLARALAMPVIAATLAAGCASLPLAPAGAGANVRPEPGSVLRSMTIDSALEERILALDPERITQEEVRDTLAKTPAPRIVLVHGGIFPVHLAMVSFGRFLTGMGYPENRLRHPGDQRWSHSPYETSAQIGGFVAWSYEQEGLRPMLIGHSQGGVQAVKILYDLAGRFEPAIPVWNPYTDAAEDRTSFVDPLTGTVRPVVGLSLSYVSVVGAGSAGLLMPNQWSMVGRLYTIPDTVDEFTGYDIDFDIFALAPGRESGRLFLANGEAKVRNVTLPAGTEHITLPAVRALLDDPALLTWIAAYTPDDPARGTPPESRHAVLWAADVWYSVKKHWALEAQRLVRARRAALGRP